MPYNIIDLFSGVGGLSYGFALRGEFRILAANEIDPDIARAYQLNHPSVQMLNCDIRDLDGETLQAALGGRTVHLILGGPPCQSYSTVGRRRMDGRARLFLEYRRVVELLMPRAFVFENVTGILSMEKGRLFRWVQDEFAALGYELRAEVLNAVRYGVPQNRERVFLVGTLGPNGFTPPPPTHGEGLLPPVTLGEALGDLPPLKSGEESGVYAAPPANDFQRFVRDTGALTEHRSPRNAPHLIRLMEALGDGESKDDLPEELRPRSGYPNTYAKLWLDRPSTTITRNFACPSSSRCIHPRDSRAMSIREGARLQSFPDSYRFWGGDGKKRLEIGNAVPPLLSMALAEEILRLLGPPPEE